MALGQAHLGVEHVLLALLRAEESPAVVLLAELAVSPDDVERRVRRLGD